VPELLVPKLNNNDADYVLTDWLVPDGAAVAPGTPVAVVETSKAAEELEADAPGVLHHRRPTGARCAPGEPIALITDGSAPEAPSGSAPARAAAPVGGPLVTRPAQALIDELGIPPEEVAALGVPVVKREHVEALRDSLAAPSLASASTAAGTTAAPAAPFAGERVELGRVQQGVARAVRLSHQSIPAAYTVVRMDLGPALAYARGMTRQVRRPVGLAELFVREVALLQPEFPRFFAAVDEDGRGATLAEAAHVGVTVDVGEGLYVPCVRDAGKRTLGEIATQLMAYRVAASTGGFRERDLTGANFVVTLHTDADVVLAVPFVLPGTVCALAVTSPVDGAGANIGLAYDHRLINGRDASLFLHALRTSLEGLTS
jgi:2-oxoglutarate dehydrogenase E2 component (dihydrolipoamide succinyltransferase)